jgi:16S rRNA processing protein RimM
VRVVVGRIGRPHGVRGAVTVECRTDEPDERFAPGAVLLVEDAPSLVVSGSQWHSGRLLVQFVGVDDRSAAEALRGTLLEVERDDAERPADPEEFYDTALVGCRVVTTEGVTVGTVTEVAHLPAQDLLVIATDAGEVLIPFVSALVPEVDLSARLITVDAPPGLLDQQDD